MYQDAEGFEWGEPTDPVGNVYLLTTGQLMVFTPCGHQIPEYQKSEISKETINGIIDKAQKVHIARWMSRCGQWSHEISKTELRALMGSGLSLSQKLKPGSAGGTGRRC